MVKSACLNDALLEVFQLKASPLEGQSLQQKEKKTGKRKGKKEIKNIKKPKDVGHFLVQKLHLIHLKILISMHAKPKCHKMQC